MIDFHHEQELLKAKESLNAGMAGKEAAEEKVTVLTAEAMKLKRIYDQLNSRYQDLAKLKNSQLEAKEAELKAKDVDVAALKTRVSELLKESISAFVMGFLNFRE